MMASTPGRRTNRRLGTIIVSSDVGVRRRTVAIGAAAAVLFIGLLLLFTVFGLRGTIAALCVRSG
jgi:hypothetical protein